MRCSVADPGLTLGGVDLVNGENNKSKKSFSASFGHISIKKETENESRAKRAKKREPPPLVPLVLCLLFFGICVQTIS